LPALRTICYAHHLKSTHNCSQNPIILNINYWSNVETFSIGAEKESTIRDDSRRLRCHVSAAWSGQFLWTRASSNINSTCPLQAGCWNVVHFYSGWEYKTLSKCLNLTLNHSRGYGCLTDFLHSWKGYLWSFYR
jgi:hypothetical protein